MLVEVLTYLAVGILLVVLGLLTWKKKMINILHEYHHKNVKAEDVPAYTRQAGIGQIIIGAGLVLTAVLLLLKRRPASWVAMAAGFIGGLIVLHKAQMRYNGSWFS